MNLTSAKAFIQCCRSAWGQGVNCLNKMRSNGRTHTRLNKMIFLQCTVRHFRVTTCLVTMSGDVLGGWAGGAAEHRTAQLCALRRWTLRQIAGELLWRRQHRVRFELNDNGTRATSIWDSSFGFLILFVCRFILLFLHILFSQELYLR